jgi:hypothetical protein
VLALCAASRPAWPARKLCRRQTPRNLFTTSSHLLLTWSLLHLPTLFVLKASAAAAGATEEDEVIEQLRGLHYDEGHEASAMAERKLTQCVTRRGTPAKDGTRCELGKCKINERCVGGKCYGDPKCPYDPQCQVPRACHKPNGNCYNVYPGRALADEASRQLNKPHEPPMNLPDDTVCDDGNPDTDVDRCKNGKCVGATTCPGEFNCITPALAIEPQYCSNPSNPFACGCATSIEGTKVCYQHGSCASFATCTTTEDCPSGAKCMPNTCCRENKCLYPCSAADSRKLEEEVDGDGECVPTTNALCP